MTMKPSLQLRVSTGLTLTPQLQQSIRLLQLSTLELNQEIARLVQENPLLELEDGFNHQESEVIDTSTSQVLFQTEDTDSHSDDEDFSSTVEDWSDESPYASQELIFETRRINNIDNDTDFSQITSNPINLREHLLAQIHLSPLSEREKNIAGLLVDCLNDDGYLVQNLDELCELLPAELEISKADLESGLKHVQTLDPTGIGARNLRECLSLQLSSLQDMPSLREDALKLVNEHLDSFAAKNFQQLKKVLNCDDVRLQAIYQLITRLNPRPGANYGSATARYITPDVVVVRSEQGWVVQLNTNTISPIRINRHYANLLKQHRKEASQPLMEQLKEARWLIRTVDQRQQTILRVSQAIIDYQQGFLEKGEIAIRPLVMREIAESLDLHESTISRVTTHKYMLTPHGVFELKYFFSSHIPAETGEAHSAVAVREVIKQLIEQENPKKPLSDAKISQMLADQGIIIARRTVAKYREFMHIPSTSLRKMP